jgi:hypothetical protein
MLVNMSGGHAPELKSRNPDFGYVGNPPNSPDMKLKRNLVIGIALHHFLQDSFFRLGP